MSTENDNKTNNKATIVTKEAEKINKTEKKKEKRFELKKWNAVAMWAYDITVDNCGICRNHIMDICIECQADQSRMGDQDIGKCNVCWGACNHAFHSHCISRWLEHRDVCPLCNSEWESGRHRDHDHDHSDYDDDH